MRAVSIFCAVAALSLTACSPSGATGKTTPTPAPHRPAALGGPTTLRYVFDQDTGTAVTDSSGNGYQGKVLAANGGTVRWVTGWAGKGRAAQFPALCGGSGCDQPTAVIKVAHSRDITPNAAPFAFGASVRLSQPTPGANVIQKGVFTNRVQWKLQVDKGIPSCVMRNRDRRLSIRTPLKLELKLTTGKWYDLECRKTGGYVALLVDGVERARHDVTLGDMRNQAPIFIGAKGPGAANNDQLHGTLDNVFVRLNARV